MFALLEAIEIILIVLAVAVAVTQLLIPLIKGTKLFPFFRTREGELLRQRAAIMEEKAEVLLEKGIDEAKKEVEKLRQDFKTKEEK